MIAASCSWISNYLTSVRHCLLAEYSLDKMYELGKVGDQKNNSKLQISAPDSSISSDHMLLLLIVALTVNCFSCKGQHINLPAAKSDSDCLFSVSSSISRQHSTAAANRHFWQPPSLNAEGAWSSFCPLVLALCCAPCGSPSPFRPPPAALKCQSSPASLCQISLLQWQLLLKSSPYSVLRGHCPFDTPTRFCALGIWSFISYQGCPTFGPWATLEEEELSWATH